MNKWSRRDFIKAGAAATAGSAIAGISGCTTTLPSAPPYHLSYKGDKPNILFVFTDQQTVDAMSAMGNPYLQTPAMDSLAAIGVRFERSYCTSPVCSPSRSSLITGRMPHETGVDYNDMSPNPSIENMGHVFRRAGYRTVWGGKWHLPKSYPTSGTGGYQQRIPGFELLPFHEPDSPAWHLGDITDPPLTDRVIQFFKSQPKQPFLLAVSYHNPHDICYAPFKPASYPPVMDINSAPPLPDNFEISAHEPDVIKHKRTISHYGREISLTAEWGEKEWRNYIYHYYRMTERVDREIGRLLHALEETVIEKDTLVVFTSDHGDGVASHRWAAKLSLYEESVTVPMIIAWPGKTPCGVRDTQHIVSGLDVLPTLCDYAGIEGPPHMRGMSLRGIIENPAAKGRDFVVTELAPDPAIKQMKGRLVRSARYKYNLYSMGEVKEELFDLESDPGETVNLAFEPAMAAIIRQHRTYLDEWMKETHDDFAIITT